MTIRSSFPIIGTRSLGLLILAALVVAGMLPAFAQQSTSPSTGQGRKVTLRDQLTAGLKAKTKADLAFIDKVVVQVEQGKLPRRLVDSTFFWSRDRAVRKSPTRRLRPMVYFQPALTQQAKRIGVAL